MCIGDELMYVVKINGREEMESLSEKQMGFIYCMNEIVWWGTLM